VPRSNKKAKVRVVAGDVLDAAAVDVAADGQDAVIDALGVKTPWKVTTMETSAAHNMWKRCGAMACGDC
jgi:hypothetical protein